VAKNTYTMSVLGSSFTLRSDDEPQHLRSVAEYFIRSVQEVERALPTASPLRVAVLSALNIADELLKERRARQQGLPVPEPDSREILEITQRIISSIDDSLRDSDS
jgi:cell division protein ZapA